MGDCMHVWMRNEIKKHNYGLVDSYKLTQLLSPFTVKGNYIVEAVVYWLIYLFDSDIIFHCRLWGVVLRWFVPENVLKQLRKKCKFVQL